MKRKHRQFTLIRVQTIANFEGQLTVDPNDLEIDDSEYEEILQGLR
jgi:hypothetical protein